MILAVLLVLLGIVAGLLLLFIIAATLFDYLTRPRWRSSYSPDKETPPRGWKGTP